MMDNVNERWQQTKSYVDELTRNIERAQLSRRVADELSTLRDVHEGYQKYINNAERYSNDPQKLNLQLETNKVEIDIEIEIYSCFIVLLTFKTDR